MPIRAEYRKYYDARWREFRLAVLDAAGHSCQRCSKTHRLLNVAHLSHDPANRLSVAVLCPSCHAKNDTPQRFAMTRRTWARQRGQLWLLEEVRWAPYPIRMWPKWLRQMELF
jgi:5-methylcytosine-specific restriction endonuclease McrA